MDAQKHTQSDIPGSIDKCDESCLDLFSLIPRHILSPFLMFDAGLYLELSDARVGEGLRDDSCFSMGGPA